MVHSPYTFNFLGTTRVRAPLQKQILSYSPPECSWTMVRCESWGILSLSAFVDRCVVCSSSAFCRCTLGGSNSSHWQGQAHHKSCRRTFVSYQARQHPSPLVIHASTEKALNVIHLYMINKARECCLAHSATTVSFQVNTLVCHQ